MFKSATPSQVRENYMGSCVGVRCLKLFVRVFFKFLRIDKIINNRNNIFKIEKIAIFLKQWH